jgi:hypothetical protein
MSFTSGRLTKTQTNLDRSSRTSSWVACLYEKRSWVSVAGADDISGDEDDEEVMVDDKKDKKRVGMSHCRARRR